MDGVPDKVGRDDTVLVSDIREVYVHGGIRTAAVQSEWRGVLAAAAADVGVVLS